MPEPALVLYDDARARTWDPFARTRPAGELRFGTATLRGRAERVLGGRCVGHLAADHLRGLDEPWSAPVVRAETLPETDLLFWCSRAVADAAPGLGAEPCLLAMEGELVGWWAPAGTARPTPEDLLDLSAAAPDHLPVRAVEGTLLRDIWDLVLGSPERIARDVGSPALTRRVADVTDQADVPGVAVLGDHRLILGKGVEIEPGVVLDLRQGPVWLEDDVVVRAFTRLEGPSHVASASTLLGGSLTAVTVGPVCKIHGEVEETIFLGYANKAHDGFLGHALVGVWCNLGALTTNSDLKNNYGPVRLWTPEGVRDTGSIKVGCFLGDHVKTAIGTMINTGTVVGTGSNLFGGMPDKVVPPFSWGTGEGRDLYGFDRFLETAERVMARREVELTEPQRTLLRQAWERAREERDPA